MTNTKEGAQKARDHNLAKDPNYYKNIGRIGGRAPTTGGFKDKELAKRASKAGLKKRWGNKHADDNLAVHDGTVE